MGNSRGLVLLVLVMSSAPAPVGSGASFEARTLRRL